MYGSFVLLPQVFRSHHAKLFFVTLLMMLTAVVQAQTRSCQKIYAVSQEIQSQNTSLEQFIRNRYWTKEHVYTVQDFQNQWRGMQTKLYYIRPALGGFTVKTIRLSSAIQKPGLPLIGHPFQEIVIESIHLVLDNYALRREWTPTFRDHLYDQAMLDSGRSTYLQFYAFDGFKIQDILKGTLKIIEATKSQNQDLPVDRNLGIVLPYNGGLKFELANFAIDKQYNKEAFTEILLQLMMHAKGVTERPNHEADKMIYFTYADASSYRMYKGLGFTPVPGFEKPIEKDGTKWIPMGISAEGILKIPETIQKTRSNQWDPEVLQYMLKTFEGLNLMTKGKLNTGFWALSDISVTLFRPDPSLSVPEKFREIRIVQESTRKTLFQIPVPFSFIPLKENSSATVTHEGHSYSLHFQQGILKISIDGKKTIRIQVDSNFDFIDSLSLL